MDAPSPESCPHTSIPRTEREQGKQLSLAQDYLLIEEGASACFFPQPHLCGAADKQSRKMTWVCKYMTSAHTDFTRVKRKSNRVAEPRESIQERAQVNSSMHKSTLTHQLLVLCGTNSFHILSLTSPHLSKRKRNSLEYQWLHF